MVDHAAEQSLRDEVQQYGSLWPIPADITVEFARSTGVTDLYLIRNRFLGVHDSWSSVARTLAASSYPTDGPAGLARVDFDAWPFSHIDWHTAAAALSPAFDDGTILSFPGEGAARYYFDAHSVG